jgi:hypothetical protein
MSQTQFSALETAVPALGSAIPRVPPSVELRQSLMSRVTDIPRYVPNADRRGSHNR